MTDLRMRTKRVRLTPMRRLRILIDQRMAGFNNAKLISPEFISDMISSYEKQTKSLVRNLLLGSIYLAIMFTAYSGSGVKIAILAIDFSDVPKLLEISVVLFSFSLFGAGILFLNQQILIQSIDSMISSVVPNDDLSQGLIKYRYAPLINFFSPFQASFRNEGETISPVGITRVFNAIMAWIALVAYFSIFLIPIVFMLAFVVPSLTTNVVSIGVGGLAWACSCFFICSLMVLILRLPYDEILVDDLPPNKNEAP